MLRRYVEGGDSILGVGNIITESVPFEVGPEEGMYKVEVSVSHAENGTRKARCWGMPGVEDGRCCRKAGWRLSSEGSCTPQELELHSQASRGLQRSSGILTLHH